MKIAGIKLSGTSIALLVIQLAIVSSIAAKYLYQRWTCPHVWTRTVAYDPESVSYTHLDVYKRQPCRSATG